MLAPWRSPLAQALECNRQPNARYLQLATIRENNRPANRTVVFRGFYADTDQLKFVVDARSQKIIQIEQQPWAEACWYFPQTREQFRISGSLTLVPESHPDSALQQARQITWQQLSDAARIQYTWSEPGKPRANSALERSPPDLVQPLPNFCLLLLQPLQVDHLELHGEPHNRAIYCRNGNQWSVQVINP